MRLVFSLLTVCVALGLAGCGTPTGQTQACSICGGSGRAASGAGCTFCAGRGYREVSKAEADRRKLADENARRRESGQTPLSDGEWWWKTTGGGCCGGVVLLVLYLLSRHRRGRAS